MAGEGIETHSAHQLILPGGLVEPAVDHGAPIDRVVQSGLRVEAVMHVFIEREITEETD